MDVGVKWWNRLDFVVCFMGEAVGDKSFCGSLGRKDYFLVIFSFIFLVY